MDPVTICNMALGALGAHKITSLDDASIEAELCKTYYDPAVLYVLEQVAWLFATGSIDLGAAQASGEEEFPSYFNVPAYVLSILRVDDGSGTFTMEYERRGDRLYTVASDKCVVKATRNDIAINKWTPTFCWTVAYKIAETIAVPITESLGVEARMEKKYERELAKATTLDAMQGSSEPLRVVQQDGRGSLLTRR